MDWKLEIIYFDNEDYDLNHQHRQYFFHEISDANVLEFFFCFFFVFVFVLVVFYLYHFHSTVNPLLFSLLLFY